MIVKVLRGQPEIRVVLAVPGTVDERRLDPERARLIITAPRPPSHGGVSRIIRRGWWPFPPMSGQPDVYPPDPDLWPALVYPCFEVDDDGALVFRLDDLFFDRPCGRYIGRLEVDGRAVKDFDIDYHPRRWAVSMVEAGPPQRSARHGNR